MASTRGSKRYSTLSASPSLSSTLTGPPPSAAAASSTATEASSGTTTTTATLTPSTAETGRSTTTTTADPRLQDIRALQSGLARLESKRLQQQRYQPSQEKSDSLAQLALTAKVERALGRRMTGQDAVLRVKARPPLAVGGAEKQG